MESIKKTAVEWIAEKYNYIIWLRNKDEISPFKADELRAKYLEQAKEMEKQQHKETWFLSTSQFANESEMLYKKDFEQYFNEKFKNK